MSGTPQNLPGMDRKEPSQAIIPAWREPWTRGLVAILAMAAALRAWLVLHGGQFFWMDESRYYVAREGVARLAEGDGAGFWRQLLGTADHLFFKVLALLPAAVQSRTGDSMLVPAFFFAAFSVVNIFLVWRIARAAGAGTREACLAALLLAGANTNFYYARHLLPYDTALTFGLLALLTGWTGAGWWRSLGCGLLAALCFLTYNGCWLFGAVVLVGHVLLASDVKRAAGRAGLAGLGLVLPIALVIGLARWLAQADLVASFRGFAGSINQGDFGRGWQLLAEYFWAAEGLNTVLALLLVTGAAVVARRRQYGRWWVAGLLALLAGLLLASDFWHKFVIYGRTARQLVPLACLAGAFALERLWHANGVARRLAVAVLGLGAAQAAVNFGGPLAQVFPPQFQGMGERRIQQLQAQGEARQLVLLYADRLVGREGLVSGLPAHHVMLATGHPLEFTPYLFEGFPADLRRLFKATDIRMRLIALDAGLIPQSADLRLPYPGIVRLTLRLPQGKTGAQEPLLVTGKTGAGDLIYVIYHSPTSIRLGFDHWGAPGTITEPLPVDYDQLVTVVLSNGALHNSGPDPLPADTGPDLRHWLYAEVNGRKVWSQPAEFHAAPPTMIYFGANLIGGSTCGRWFTGTIDKVESLASPSGLSAPP